MIPFLCFLCMTPDRSLYSPQTRQSVSVSCSHSGSLSLSFASLVVFIHFIIFFNSFVLVEVFLVNTEPGVVGEQSYKGARWTLERKKALSAFDSKAEWGRLFPIGFLCHYMLLSRGQECTASDMNRRESWIGLCPSGGLLNSLWVFLCVRKLKINKISLQVVAVFCSVWR